MAANVAMTSLQWTQPPVSHSPSCPQTLASSRKRSGNDVVSSLYAHRLDRSPMFSVGGGAPSKLSRARSCEIPKPKIRSIVRASSASFDFSSDDEFSKKIEELAMKFNLSDDNTKAEETQLESSFNSFLIEDRNRLLSNIELVESRWGEIYREPPDFPAMDQGIVIERKANSLDLPFSLRIIRKKQSQLGIRESAYCSVKKAFSSMVFIIQELHSYTLQMREFLFYEDLQGILARVHKEMHASFVWLFQQVFSHTPTLMVYVMILLANFTVHSLASNAFVTASPETLTATVEVTSTLESPNTSSQKFDSSSVKSFSVSGTGNSKTAAVGGSHGGGGNTKPVASGADEDGRINRSGHLHPGTSNKFSPLTAREEESVSGKEEIGEELKLWNAIVYEASRMQAELRDDSLDSDTIQKFVSPVTAKIESDEEYPEFFRTELLYRTGLAQEPDNPLLLANFAQFLYTVAHDNDRAEEYFKAAMSIEPKDAEACNKYANFLWHVKKDLWGAEETYLEAISADPSNTYYAANYAHFLWNTGGEDTCYPLDAEGAEA
ncbi:hypothetical protein V2J09_006987 [Rumex salicifolius]